MYYSGVLFTDYFLFIAVLLDAIFAICPGIIVFFVWKTLPVISDKLALKQELQYIVVCVLISFVGAIVLYFLCYLVFKLILKEFDVFVVAHALIIITGALFAFLAFCVQTVWVVYKFRDDLQKYSLRDLMNEKVLSFKSKTTDAKNITLFQVYLLLDFSFLSFLYDIRFLVTQKHFHYSCSI